MTPNWEGFFRVTKEVEKGVYRLEHLDGKKIPQTWNAINLRMLATKAGPGHEDETYKRPTTKAGPRHERPVKGRPLRLVPSTRDP
ncbi:hypothetical protein CR513_47842, partial [Mucuna pruriens]